MAGGSDSSLRWIVTYADMISLLMVLFLMLFSASQVEKEKLLAISQAMRKSLHKDAVESTSTGASLLARPSDTSPTAVSEALREAARALGIDKSVSVSTDERGLAISIVDAVFFESGQTAILPQVRPLLSEVAQFCRQTRADVRIEGHTDNQPIEKGAGLVRSNWQLSALRATEVAEFFISDAGVDPRKISATAYGATRPLVPNTSLANRARNRRIDIILLNAEVLPRKPERGSSLTQLDLMERKPAIQDGHQTIGQDTPEGNAPSDAAHK